MDCVRSGCTKAATATGLCHDHQVELQRQLKRERRARRMNQRQKPREMPLSDPAPLRDNFDEFTFDPREGMPVTTISRSELKKSHSLLKALPRHRNR